MFRPGWCGDENLINCRTVGVMIIDLKFNDQHADVTFIWLECQINLIPSLLWRCSDTVSRCGVFCALLNCIECCKTESTVDVFQAVKALRLQKPGMVQTVVSWSQYGDKSASIKVWLCFSLVTEPVSVHSWLDATVPKVILSIFKLQVTKLAQLLFN